MSTCTEHCECQLCLSATNNPPGDWPSCLSRTNGRNSGRLFWKHVGLFAHLFECQLGQAHRGCWRFPVPTSLPCYPFSQGVPAAPEQRGGEAGGRLPRTMPRLGPLGLTAGPQRCPVNSDVVTFWLARIPRALQMGSGHRDVAVLWRPQGWLRGSARLGTDGPGPCWPGFSAYPMASLSPRPGDPDPRGGQLLTTGPGVPFTHSLAGSLLAPPVTSKAGACPRLFAAVT